MSFSKLAGRVPIDRLAMRVSSQKGCVDDIGVSIQDIKILLARLERKMRLMKHVLGVNTRSQHKNLMYRFNKNGNPNAKHGQKRIFLEYKRVGENMHLLMFTAKALKSESLSSKAAA